MNGRHGLREEIARVEERIRLNAQYAARNLLPADMMADEQGPLVAERERLRSQIGNLEAAEVSLTEGELRWLREATEEGLARLESADYGRQREFLQRLFVRVELHKDRMVFHHTVDLPPKTVPIPAYYAPKRGDQIIIPPD